MKLFKSILLSDLDDNITIYKNLGYHISSLKKDTIIKDEVFINILEELEENGLYVEADALHEIFVKLSKKKAKKNTKRLTAIKKPICPPGKEVSNSSIQRSPSTPLNVSPNTVDPIKIKMTIALIRIVDVIACQTRSFSRRLLIAAKANAPTAPIAPPSVGVARPIKMVPRTKKMSTSDGTMPHRIRLKSFQSIGGRASLGKAGTYSGLMIETIKMNRQKSNTWIIDGPIAPAYISPTDLPN